MFLTVVGLDSFAFTVLPSQEDLRFSGWDAGVKKFSCVEQGRRLNFAAAACYRGVVDHVDRASMLAH